MGCAARGRARPRESVLLANWPVRAALSLLLCSALPALAVAQTPDPIVAAGDGDVDKTEPGSAATSTAAGDDADATQTVYPPDFFARFQPNTAADMVAQIPGFSLRGGGDGARGFGEASSNFLINGRRPSTKGQDARDLLGRIPASSVVRIEVLDGASLDLPGLSGQVVNVVARTVDLSGSWEYAARFEEGTSPQLLDGQVNISGETGNLGFALTLNSGQFTRTEDGFEVFADDRLDAGGAVFEDRLEFLYIDNQRPSASLNLSWTPENGHVANLNTRIQKPNSNSGVREIFTALTPDGETGTSEAAGGEDELEYEISGDYALPVGPGTLKLIGLWRDEDSDFTTVFTDGVVGADPVQLVFLRAEEEQERIARAEYAFGVGEAHDVQVSLEYAFNALDSRTSFASTQFDGAVLDAVAVEEDRFEGRVSDSWTVTDALTLQGSIGAEYSELGVVAPGEEPRSFFRPKGFLATSYQLSERYTARARIERGVGQLNFGTFVSRRGLIDGTVTSGNEEIKPDQFWSLSAELERTDPDLFSARIEPFYRRISDPIDQVLFADGTEGPGNLDSAERYGVDAEATLLMDRLGVPGLRFDLEGSLADSSIDDPLTQRPRRLNNQTLVSWEVEARYDVPDTTIALTAEIEGERYSPSFRFDEVQQIAFTAPVVDLGIIFKDIAGLQLGIRVQNVTDGGFSRDRERYFGEQRRLGPIGQYERFERYLGRRLNFELSGTF